jgi:putative restriction endonuclease
MNGLLFSALWDAAFDQGLVSFSEAGLSNEARDHLTATKLLPIQPEHIPYLSWHRSTHSFA